MLKQSGTTILKKNKFEKEIENYQKLIETKTVTSKTETNNYGNNGDVYKDIGGDVFARGSKNNKTTNHNYQERKNRQCLI